MKNLLCFCALIALLTSLPACSKKSEGNTKATAATETAPVVPAANSRPAPQPSNPAAAAAVNSLPEVSRAVQNGQYESAVQTLTQMKSVTAQMTDAQRLQYQQAMRDTAGTLLGVMDKDPAAKAAYEKLSRAATGR